MADDAVRDAWWRGYDAGSGDAPAWQRPVPFAELARWLVGLHGSGQANAIGTLTEQLEKARRGRTDPVREFADVLLRFALEYPTEWAALVRRALDHAPTKEAPHAAGLRAAAPNGQRNSAR